MRNKAIAYVLGVICHVSFGAAIGLMAYMLATGLTQGVLPIGGEYGRWANIVLLLQFPVLHSYFLTPSGRKLLASPLPRELQAPLATTLYALFASLQLLAVFVFWTPHPTVWFEPTGALMAISVAAYAASWILLVVSLSEAGMAMHTGWLGWRAVVTGRKPEYPGLPTKGLHSRSRHPIYLSFSLIILTAPVWSFDHAALALIWVLYCLIGPKYKEKRIRSRAAEQYRLIEETVPYFIPRLMPTRSRHRPATGSVRVDK